MNEKSQVLAALREELDWWEGMLAGLSEEEITARQLPSELSIKDVIGHLRAWQTRTVARLEAARHGGEPDFGDWPKDLKSDSEEDLDRINAWVHATYRDQPWEQVHRVWREGYERVLELGEALPEEDLTTVGRYPWLADYPLLILLQSTYEHHHEEHREPLEAWLREHGKLGGDGGR